MRIKTSNMKLKVTWIILMLSASSLFGQTSKKCDTAILVSTNDKSGKLNQEEIKDFLSTLGKDCKDNVEFSEWSNELLFTVLSKQTDLTLKMIEKLEYKVELDVILEILKSPISDINIKNILSQVNKVKINKGLKKQIINSLTIANSKLTDAEKAHYLQH
jgi:hypothetical protein